MDTGKCARPFLPQYLYGFAGGESPGGFYFDLFNAAFQELEIPAVFMDWPLEADNLEQFLRSMPIVKIMGAAMAGALQRAILPLLDNLSEAASLGERADTIFWRDGFICGENLVVAVFPGLLSGVELDKIDALLLGDGTLAHAAAAALRLNGCMQVRISAPDDAGQFELAERFGFSSVLWQKRHCQPATLVINALGKGLAGMAAYDFAIAPRQKNAWACALCRHCGEFLHDAALSGRKTIPFSQMSAALANARFKLWTGMDLPDSCRKFMDKPLEDNPCVS